MQLKSQIKSLVSDTILKELRSKTLFFIFISTTFFILLGHMILRYISSNIQNDPVAAAAASNSLNIMFSFVNWWAVIISAIFGISSIRSDFQDKIIYQYLTFPISRSTYVFSRIFGSWTLVFGYYLYAYFFSAILFSIASHKLVLEFSHLASMMIMGIYIFLIIILSVLFSLFAEKIPAFLMLFATVFVISISSNSLRLVPLNEYFKDLNVFKMIGILFNTFLPRVSLISELASAIMFKEEVKFHLGFETVHLILSTSLLIYFLLKYIKKKNF